MKAIGMKINLAKLTHVLMTKKGQSGQEVKCIVIPIEENNLFESDQGNVFVDLIAFEIKEPKYDDTHLIKQSLPKEVREKMTEDEKKSQPILGNANVNLNIGEGEPNNPAGAGATVGENDDLPF